MGMIFYLFKLVYLSLSQFPSGIPADLSKVDAWERGVQFGVWCGVCASALFVLGAGGLSWGISWIVEAWR
jgi:hypothetical protein